MNRLFIHQALFRILAAPVLGVIMISLNWKIFLAELKYMFALA